MSRLQVGGLALIIKGCVDQRNVGKVVKLIEFVPEFYGISSCWNVECESLIEFEGGYLSKVGIVEQYRLMPLGDKQTQDELAKEKEHEFN